MINAMKNVVLYIAMSLDGYIADSQKSVNWIQGHGYVSEMVDTYSAFFETVDTVLMGRYTYEQITTELSPDKWVYEGATSYVFTHTPAPDANNIKFINADPCQLIRKLKGESGKNIWICGGADLINQVLKENLIDIFHIAIIPTLLGGGVKLFDKIGDTINLRLLKTLNYNGIIEAVYERR